MRVIYAAALLSLLAGCTANSSFQAHPNSIGGGPNGLKRTPCACKELDQKQGLPDYLHSTEQASA